MPDTYLNTGVRATGGVRGKVGDAWTYDVGGVYARNQQDYYAQRFANFDRVNNSLNVVNVNGAPTCASDRGSPRCVPFDAFSAGNTNPALIDYLFTAHGGRDQGVGTLYDVQANVTGDLGKYGITSPFAEAGRRDRAGRRISQGYAAHRPPTPSYPRRSTAAPIGYLSRTSGKPTSRSRRRWSSTSRSRPVAGQRRLPRVEVQQQSRAPSTPGRSRASTRRSAT